MEPFWTAIIGRQMDATLHMFADVLKGCPEALWTADLWTDEGAPVGMSQYWSAC